MEASAAPATPTTEEYVKEVPLKYRIPHPHGGEVGAVYQLNEDDTEVHAIMANKLPKHVIIQSNLNNVYLHLYKGNPAVPNALRYTGDYSFDLDTRFMVVPSTTVTGFVHILCLKNNKYWANFGTRNNWVAAMAVKPEENQSDKHCTLFQPIFRYSNNNQVLKLRHVSSGKYARLFYGGAGHYDHCLSLMSNKDEDWCTFLDWQSIVMLPEVIRIEGDNGKHLQAYGVEGFMDCNREADNSSRFEYVVSPSRNGGIRLKSKYYNDKYWTHDADSKWVLLKKASTTVHHTNTVFLPTRLDDNRIIMRCLRNNMFCKRYTNADKTNCLAARVTYPDNPSNMDIVQPVISRKISNVIYHLNDARLYNEKTVALVTDDTTNGLQDPLTKSLNLKTTVTNTTNWSTSSSFKLGLSMTLSYGVPFVASGKLEVSTEITQSSGWGETETETIEVGSVKKITVPPMTRVKGTLMARRLSYDIPFSYTQHDVLMDGSTIFYKKNDGLFTGHDGHGYKYEVVPVPFE